MLDPDAFGVVVRTSVSFVVVLFVWRYVLRSTMVETYRQRLFEVRRDLFLLQVDGVVVPDRAYRLMVQSINAQLRFADGLTLLRLVISLVAYRKSPAPDEFDIALAKSTVANQAHLPRFRQRLGYEIVRHAAVTSPLAWTLFLLSLPLAILKMVNRAAFIRRATAIGSRPGVRRIESDVRDMFPDDVAIA